MSKIYYVANDSPFKKALMRHVMSFTNRHDGLDSARAIMIRVAGTHKIQNIDPRLYEELIIALREGRAPL
jgi:hypothetical protein